MLSCSFVFGIGQRRQVFFISGRSSDVFWGSAAFAADARRILRGRLRQEDGLQHQVMLPAVAEIGIDMRTRSPHGARPPRAARGFHRSPDWPPPTTPVPDVPAMSALVRRLSAIRAVVSSECHSSVAAPGDAGANRIGVKIRPILRDEVIAW